MHRVTRHRGSCAGIFFNLAAGIGYIYTHPMVFAIMILTVLHCALTMAFESVIAVFLPQYLGDDDRRRSV